MKKPTARFIRSEIMREFMRTEWGRWAKANDLIVSKPCGDLNHYRNRNKPHKGPLACQACRSWNDQARKITRAHQLRHRNGPEEPIEVIKAPRRAVVIAVPAPTIDAVPMSAGRVVVRDPQLAGYVYLVTHPLHIGWVKIGSTVDPAARLSTYQTSDPFRRFEMLFHTPVDDRVAIERWVLRFLARHHTVKGEWVNCSSDEAIDRIREALLIVGIGVEKP